MLLLLVLTTGKAPVTLLARISRRLINELLFDDDPLLPEPEPDVWKLLKAKASLR
ncbi:MAG: hypothetical protein NVSMB27_34940 [Ktedonobacteraceae bacterium]